MGPFGKAKGEEASAFSEANIEDDLHVMQLLHANVAPNQMPRIGDWSLLTTRELHTSFLLYKTSQERNIK